MKYDFLIVGSGLYGAVFAHECKKHNKTCLVIEKRNTIGGNLYCENIRGINVHKYGPHIFHTSNKYIWDYVNNLCEFNNFRYTPIANYKGKLYSLPFNMLTFNQMWGCITPEEAKNCIDKSRPNKIDTSTLEGCAINMVGSDIYERLIKHYTEKQWGRSCIELPNDIIKRLPLRFTYDNNYYFDKYQGIPIGGYNVLINSLLKDVEIKINYDFFEHYDELKNIAKTIVYTGPIDKFFNYKYGKLEYRSLRFEEEILDNCTNFQGVAGMNYTYKEPKYTRIIEHKHFECLNENEINNIKDSVITKEYSQEWVEGCEPYYPINNKKNNELYQKYLNDTLHIPNVIFGGRLAEYKYYDMDDTIEQVLLYWKDI